MLHENTKKLDENIPWTMNSVQVYIYSFKTMRLAIMDCHPGWWESYQDQESSDGRYMKVLYLEIMYTRIGFLLFLASGVPFFFGMHQIHPNIMTYHDSDDEKHHSSAECGSKETSHSDKIQRRPATVTATYSHLFAGWHLPQVHRPRFFLAASCSFHISATKKHIKTLVQVIVRADFECLRKGGVVTDSARRSVCA